MYKSKNDLDSCILPGAIRKHGVYDKETKVS